jgi:HEAT repeat protein
MRAGAAEVLARIGPAARAAAPALRQTLKTEPERQPDGGEWPARTWAAIALLNLGEQDVVPLLIQTHIALVAQLRQTELGRASFDHYRARHDRMDATAEALRRAAKSRESRVLPSLIEELGVDRESDRAAAADVLLSIHTAKTAPVVKALADALLNGEASLRYEAAKLLGRIGRGGEEAVPALHHALTHPSPMVRVAAAAALWRIEGKVDDVLPTLRDVLEDPLCDDRDSVLREIGELGAAAAPCLREVAACWRDEPWLSTTRIDTFFRIAPDAVPALLDLLGHREEAVRDRATHLLGTFGPAAVAPLSRAVGRTEGPARRAAVEALRWQGEAAREALPVLRPLLKDFDERLRFSAALAVWTIGNEAKEPLPIFLDAVRRADVADRRRAAEALGGMAELAKGAAPVLEQALADDDEAVRAAAARALGQVPEARRALPALVRTLRTDDSAEVRKGAARALRELAGDEAEARRLVGPLTAALNDRDEEVRSGVIHAFAYFPRSVPVPGDALVEHLDDDPVCRAAMQVLADKSHVPVLTAGLTHTRPTVRMRSAWMLGQIGAEARDAVPELICALRARDDLRLHAAKALGAVGPPAREALVALRAAAMDNEDEPLRDAAAEALKQIEKPTPP